VPHHALSAMRRVEGPPQESATLAEVPPEEGDVSRQRKLLIPSVRAALEEGLAHPVGGEVVVRSGDAIGRIYLYKGAIAWVNCTQLQVGVRDTLLANTDILSEELNAALQESQQLRQHFAETLLAWGLISRERLWECLLIHNARHLGAIAQLRHEPQSLFVPLVRTYSAGLIFKLEEMLGWIESHGSVMTEPQEQEPPPVAPQLAAPEEALVQPGIAPAKAGERLGALLPEGTLAAAMFDTEDRQVHAHFSRLPELSSSLELLSAWLLEVVEGQGSQDPARKVLMVAEDAVHVVSRLEQEPSLYLWLMFDSSTSVGNALAQCHLALKNLRQERGTQP
jgi:hypothetical protein